MSETIPTELPSLSFLFPAWNEQDGIERAVRAALDCGDQLLAEDRISDARVLVVDDGSSDATAEILGRLARVDDRVVPLHHATNQGLGAALRTGFASVTTDVVFYTDADLPVDLSVVGTALDLLSTRDADIVSAYRRRRYPEGPRRLVYSITYNSIVRLAFGVRVRDVNFAAKLFRRQVVDEVVLGSRGSFIDAELLARAARRGRRIVQFPADYLPRECGQSTLSSPAVIREMLAEMISLRSQIRNEQHRQMPR